MPYNKLPQGDDQDWKKAVDRELEALRRELEQIRDLVKANS